MSQDLQTLPVGRRPKVNRKRVLSFSDSSAENLYYWRPCRQFDGSPRNVVCRCHGDKRAGIISERKKKKRRRNEWFGDCDRKVIQQRFETGEHFSMRLTLFVRDQASCTGQLGPCGAGTCQLCNCTPAYDRRLKEQWEAVSWCLLCQNTKGGLWRM